MPNFYVERESGTLHRESCAKYDPTDTGRFEDVGNHDDSAEAYKAASKGSKSIRMCPECCGYEGLAMIRASRGRTVLGYERRLGGA